MRQWGTAHGLDGVPVDDASPLPNTSRDMGAQLYYIRSSIALGNHRHTNHILGLNTGISMEALRC